MQQYHLFTYISNRSELPDKTVCRLVYIMHIIMGSCVVNNETGCSQQSSSLNMQ